jgi:glycosyltransferase involved in cell wall biosynthesis
MPVHNEEASVAKVIEEWLPVLRGLQIDFKIAAINDGSKDSTLTMLNLLADAN